MYFLEIVNTPICMPLCVKWLFSLQLFSYMNLAYRCCFSNMIFIPRITESWLRLERNLKDPWAWIPLPWAGLPNTPSICPRSHPNWAWTFTTHTSSVIFLWTVLDYNSLVNHLFSLHLSKKILWHLKYFLEQKII